MNPGHTKETTRLWRVPGLNGLELLQAHYRGQNFGPHFHEGFVVGVIEAGALGYRYLGQDNVASAGEINLALPGEVHNGFAATESGWSYRMFYFGPGRLESLVSPSPNHEPGRIRIGAGKLKDRTLAAGLRSLHISLENPAATLLEQESALTSVMSKLVARHAEVLPQAPPAGREPMAVARVKGYIRVNQGDNISLSDLSRVAGLSRFHLLRVFKKAVGLTPHAYLLQVRTANARSLMAQGEPIAEVALATGFSDQSHLNRVFKKIHGVTPGAYRNILQD